MPETVKYIILNGPPGSGKTTIARVLSHTLNYGCGVKTIQDSFAAPMKHFLAAGFGEKYQNLAKDSPNVVLNGYSPREFLIDLSERYLKERYGKDLFGRMLYHRTHRGIEFPPAVVVCDDGGFQEEVDTLPNKWIIRVKREGCNFKGDSRGYVSTEYTTFENNGTLRALANWVHVIAADYVKANFK